MEWPTVVSAFFGAALGVVVSLLSDRLRARITGEFWVAQERWQLKRETYVSLLKALFTLRSVVEDGHYVLQQAAEGKITAASADEQTSALITRVAAGALFTLKEVRVVGALWLRPATLQALDDVRTQLRESQFRDQALPLTIDAAIARVTGEAKHDLRLEVHGV